MIVEDDPAFIPLPDEVANAKDVLLLVQNFNMNADSPFMEAINAVNDTLVDIQPLDEVGESFRLVNGQYRPTLMVVPGTWTRMRLLYAGWGKQKKAFLFLSYYYLVLYIIIQNATL